jgi:hypothetical protein
VLRARALRARPAEGAGFGVVAHRFTCVTGLFGRVFRSGSCGVAVLVRAVLPVSGVAGARAAGLPAEVGHRCAGQEVVTPGGSRWRCRVSVWWRFARARALRARPAERAGFCGSGASLHGMSRIVRDGALIGQLWGRRVGACCPSRRGCGPGPRSGPACGSWPSLRGATSLRLESVRRWRRCRVGAVAVCASPGAARPARGAGRVCNSRPPLRGSPRRVSPGLLRAKLRSSHHSRHHIEGVPRARAAETTEPVSPPPGDRLCFSAQRGTSGSSGAVLTGEVTGPFRR